MIRFLIIALALFGARPALARPAPARPAAAASRAEADSIASEADLLRAYLPKEDLGVPEFLRQHPQADGRGVIVAILDTGIDLNHKGLLRTPLGERKIIDVYDATDNGLCTLPRRIQTTDSVLIGLEDPAPPVPDQRGPRALPPSRQLERGPGLDGGGRFAALALPR